MTTTLIDSDNVRDIRSIRWVVDAQRPSGAIVVTSTHCYARLARTNEPWSARSFRPMYEADRDIKAGHISRFDTMADMLQSLK
jgi:hypothetical protein